MSDQTKTQLRHTARAVIIHNDTILLMERWRPGRHYFSIPGGGIEPGESPKVTVVREVLEETSCRVEVVRLLYAFTRDDGTEHHIFLCEYIAGEPVLPADSPEALLHNPDNRCMPRWVALAKLPDLDFNIWSSVMMRLLKDMPNGLPRTPQQLV